MDVPSHLRQACERFAKKLRADVSKARAEGVADRLGASRWGGGHA
jgi:hypothetical protein